jgi:DNA polymerase-3 subunit alpha
VIVEKELRGKMEGDATVVGGVITDVRVIQTKKKEPMAFVTIMDLDEIIEVTTFPTHFVRFRELLKKDKIVEISGRKNTWGDKQNAIVADFIEEK